MNYLVAVDTFFPDRPSGSVRVAWDFGQLMRNQGHKVSFICRRQKSNDPDVSEYEGVKVFRFSFPETFSLLPFKLVKQKNAGVLAAKKSS